MSRRDAKKVASHEEVCHLVRQRNIRVASELHRLALDQEEEGDASLANYCCGARGMKRNLQQTVDAFWNAGGDCPPEHLAALSAERLAELVEQAAASAPASAPAAEVEATITERRRRSLARIRDLRADRQAERLGHGRGCGRGSGPAPGTKADPVLFDMLQRRGEIVFRPRGGVWRLRDHFELLVACGKEADLAGAVPLLDDEGGFRLARTEPGWRSMLRAWVAAPRTCFSALSAEQLASAAPLLRYSSPVGCLRWATRKVKAEEWIEEMPKNPHFETDVFKGLLQEDKLVRCYAEKHVEDRQLHAIFRVFEACGHSVQQTVNFVIQRGNMTITGTKDNCSRHKHGVGRVSFGVVAACVSASDTTSATRPRLMLGTDRSAAHRPQIGRPQTEAMVLSGVGQNKAKKLSKKAQLERKVHAILNEAAAAVAARSERGSASASAPPFRLTGEPAGDDRLPPRAKRARVSAP